MPSASLNVPHYKQDFQYSCFAAAARDLAGLVSFLSSGKPPIALLATASLPYWQETCNHVAVVVGLDDSHVYLNDPYFDAAPQRVSHADFLLAWTANACTAAILRPRP